MKRTKSKEINTIKMMVHFIDATSEIIEHEGMEKVTIRNIADLAGFNSATIYNYFEELSHLTFFASMRYVKKYIDALPQYIASTKDPLERYIQMWECFSKFSFIDPQIYHALFSSDLGGSAEELLKEYYGVFPTDLIEAPSDLMEMFFESNLTKRGRIALNDGVEKGFIESKDAEQMSELHFFIWQGVHIMFVNNRFNHTVEVATKIVMDHIRSTMQDKFLK